MDEEQHIHLGDWRRILVGDESFVFLLEVRLRTVVTYAALIVVLRLFGKRMSGQLTILEMAVMITLGAIVSAAMQIPERGVAVAILLLVWILAMQRGLGRLGFGRRRVELVAQGDAIPLVKDGELLTDRLRDAALSREQLYSALRRHDVKQLGQVKRVYLEASGDFTVRKADGSKAGLCILPRGDGAMIAKCRKDESLSVCTSCGHVRHSGRADVCPRCGDASAVTAVV